MFNLLSVAVLSSCFAIGGIAPKQVQGYQEQNQVIEEIKAPKQYVSYNDDNCVITLNIDELNNYTWNNLATYLLNENNNVFQLVEYNQAQLDITKDDYYYFEDNNFSILFLWDNFYLVDYTYKFVSLDDTTPIAFNNSLILEIYSTYYEEFKSAIELDIEANTMPSISAIFQEVSSAVTAFIGSLGTAFTSVTSLFYAEGNWTFLGVLVLIGVGAGLVYGAYRIIKGLLHRV